MLFIQEKLRAYRNGGPGRFKAQAAHRGEIQRETTGGWDREEQEALWAECVWAELSLHCGHTGSVIVSDAIVTAPLSEKNRPRLLSSL